MNNPNLQENPAISETSKNISETDLFKWFFIRTGGLATIMFLVLLLSKGCSSADLFKYNDLTVGDNTDFADLVNQVHDNPQNAYDLFARIIANRIPGFSFENSNVDIKFNSTTGNFHIEVIDRKLTEMTSITNVYRILQDTLKSAPDHLDITVQYFKKDRIITNPVSIDKVNEKIGFYNSLLPEGLQLPLFNRDLPVAIRSFGNLRYGGTLQEIVEFTQNNGELVLEVPTYDFGRSVIFISHTGLVVPFKGISKFEAPELFFNLKELMDLAKIQPIDKSRGD